MSEIERITFWDSWCIVLKDDLKARGVWAVLPTHLGICIGLGSIVGYFVPEQPVGANSNSALLSIMTGLISIEGFLLAVIIFSCQSILQNISGRGFSSFLRKTGIIHQYLYFIQFFQLVGIITLLFSTATIFIILISPEACFIRWLIGVSISGFLYFMDQTVGSATLVRDLVYFRGIFDEEQEKNTNSWD